MEASQIDDDNVVTFKHNKVPIVIFSDDEDQIDTDTEYDSNNNTTEETNHTNKKTKETKINNDTINLKKFMEEVVIDYDPFIKKEVNNNELPKNENNDKYFSHIKTNETHHENFDSNIENNKNNFENEDLDIEMSDDDIDTVVNDENNFENVNSNSQNNEIYNRNNESNDLIHPNLSYRYKKILRKALDISGKFKNCIIFFFSLEGNKYFKNIYTLNNYQNKTYCLNQICNCEKRCNKRFPDNTMASYRYKHKVQPKHMKNIQVKFLIIKNKYIKYVVKRLCYLINSDNKTDKKMVRRALRFMLSGDDAETVVNSNSINDPPEDKALKALCKKFYINETQQIETHNRDVSIKSNNKKNTQPIQEKQKEQTSKNNAKRKKQDLQNNTKHAEAPSTSNKKRKREEQPSSSSSKVPNTIPLIEENRIKRRKLKNDFIREVKSMIEIFDNKSEIIENEYTERHETLDKYKNKCDISHLSKLGFMLSISNYKITAINSDIETMIESLKRTRILFSDRDHLSEDSLSVERK